MGLFDFCDCPCLLQKQNRKDVTGYFIHKGAKDAKKVDVTGLGLREAIKPETALENDLRRHRRPEKPR